MVILENRPAHSRLLMDAASATPLVGSAQCATICMGIGEMYHLE